MELNIIKGIGDKTITLLNKLNIYTIDDLVNYYRSFDTISSEEIWDEIVAEYNNEDLANDVLESLDHEEDADFADEDGEYDVYSSSNIKASMGRYDEYYGQTAAATYGDLIADRLKGKSVSKRRDIKEILHYSE